MSRLNDLLGLQRRLQVSRELTDSLLLELLERCGSRELDKIPEKYVLTGLCLDGFWEQAALWVYRWTLPSWVLDCKMIPGFPVRLELYDEAEPQWFIVRNAPSLARAIIEGILEAHIVQERYRVALKNKA